LPAIPIGGTDDLNHNEQPGIQPGRQRCEKGRATRAGFHYRSRPASAHVLLTIEDYQRVTGGSMSLAEALAQPGDADFEFNPPRARGGVFKQADRG
jgi:hypothetical protein